MSHWIFVSFACLVMWSTSAAPSNPACTYVKSNHWPMIPELIRQFDDGNLPGEFSFKVDRLIPSSGLQFYTCEDQTWILAQDEVKVRSVRLPKQENKNSSVIHSFTICKSLDTLTGLDRIQPLTLDSQSGLLSCQSVKNENYRVVMLHRIEILKSGKVKIVKNNI